MNLLSSHKNQFMAQFLQDFYTSSAEMPKPFLVGGQVKDEIEGNFHSTAEPTANGKIFKSADSTAYIPISIIVSLKMRLRSDGSSTFAPINQIPMKRIVQNAVILQLRAYCSINGAQSFVMFNSERKTRHLFQTKTLFWYHAKMI